MKIKILVTLLIIFALNGCGGGGETPNQITDNSYNDTYTPTPTQQDDYNYTNDYDYTYVEPVYVEPIYEEPKPEEYNLSQINGVESHIKYTGAGVTIGILDGDFDLDDIEFDGVDILNKDTYVKLIYLYETSNIKHGTAMTQIIGANQDGLVKGITEGASFIIGKYKEAAIQYNIMDELGASVINNSWGPVEGLRNYLEDDRNNVILDLSVNGNNGKGIVFVFAMGNDNEDFETEKFYNHWRYLAYEYDENGTKSPKTIDDNILLVGSLDSENNRKDYSNYGSSADVFVNDDVYVNENNTLKILGGTSNATAIVSSIVAMAQEARGDLNSSVIMDLICKTATQIGDTPYDVKDINGNMRSKVFGCGKVDVDAFITAVEKF